MNKKLYVVIIMALVGLFLIRSNALSQSQVVPCQLSNPDQDTLRLFPDRTNYRTEFIRTDEVGDKRGLGGEALYKELERRLGDKWDPVWETKDIPYVFYEILKGPERTGWVFGANQGWPGADNSQLMCAFDLDGRLREFYYQKLPSMEKGLLQTRDFYSQFIGLTLEHFYIHDQLSDLRVQDKDILDLDMIGRIKDPTEKEREGFRKTLRGIKKVFIYMDDFKFDNKYKKDDSLAKIKYLVENKSKVPLLSADALKKIKKIFPEASRFTVDLVSFYGRERLIEERLQDKLVPGIEPLDMVYPVYVVYKDEAPKEPFVRGLILGYVLPLAINTPDGELRGVVAIGAEGSNKGKIISAEIGKTDLNKLDGLSLVHFYTKDVLLISKIADEKLDKIASLGSLNVDGKDATTAILRAVKKSLILVDEFYLRNFFKKDEITKKIEDYLNNPRK
ncbi:MAG: hypothetical protein Q7S30_04505 [Candidatus Omnitrophota bacterium]|nr:hypothetical protein [Candidatus Omnitrophota bacterium]